jgi:GxxExxY protein
MLTRAPSTLSADIEDVMHRIIGAAIEVHRHLGPGYLESIYHRALAVEFQERGISYSKDTGIDVIYKGRCLQGYRLDLIVESCVIVEVKAVSQLDPIHSSQVVSYLKATGLRAGLLLNFNSVAMKTGIRRIVL